MSSSADTSPASIDVLLVDDREENLIALESTLKDEKYNIVTANSGRMALKYLLSHEPSVILLDVQMPDMDGFETAKLIKQNPRTRDIPIIFVTALDRDERYTLEGYERGAIDYINKPFDSHILKSKVSTFVELAKKTRDLIAAERALLQAEVRDRKRALTELELKSLKRTQAEQKKYMDLVDNLTHALVWIADAETQQIKFLSKNVNSLLGYSQEELLSDPRVFFEFLKKEDQEIISNAISKARQSNQEQILEHRILSKDGTYRWFSTQIRLMPTDGDELELNGLSVDITHLKTLTDKLRAKNHVADLLLESSQILGKTLSIEDGLIPLADFLVQEYSKSAIIIVENFQGAPILKYASPNLGQIDSILSTFKNLYKNQIEHVTAPALLNDSEGSWNYIPLIIKGRRHGFLLLQNRVPSIHGDPSIRFLRELQNQITAFVYTYFLHEEAKAAVKLRDDFLSVASHELRTPLTPLKLQAQLLSKTLKSAQSLEPALVERTQRALLGFDKQLDKLTQLVDELLDISRMANGKLSLDFEELSPALLVEDVLQRFSEQIQKSGTAIKVAINDREFVAHWDRLRIEQVFINLLTNAMKYGQGKPIEIELRHDKPLNFAVLSIKDSGIGIAPEDLDRIFERFERAVSGKSFSGLGLGLFIVKQIVDAHQGRTEIESELGKGSSFTIRIPCAVSAENQRLIQNSLNVISSNHQGA